MNINLEFYNCFFRLIQQFLKFFVLLKIVLLFLVYALVSGCTNLRPETVVAPSEIQVEDALQTVGKGLVSLKKELLDGKVTAGLLVDEVQLTLVLTSKASDSKTLAVDVSKTLASGAPGIGGKFFGLTSLEIAEGSRVSTLVIKLKNAALAEIKNPNMLDGITIFKKDPILLEK